MTTTQEQKKSSNVVWHHATVTRELRAKLNGHGSALLWFTGLSGSGKSTLAHAVEEKLYDIGCRTYVLDGDNIRHGLNGDLGFSIEDRSENIRRIGEVGKLFVDAGFVCMTAFISPLISDRERVRNIMNTGDFIEIFCHTPIEVCEERDVKGLYKKARAGEIPEFTGISSPYEAPPNPEITVDTASESVAESADRVIQYLVKKGIVKLED